MCLPIPPSGPESVVMKPILTFCCCAMAGMENASVAATAPARMVLTVFFINSSSKEKILAQLRAQRHRLAKVPQRPVQLHVGVLQHRLDLRQLAVFHGFRQEAARLSDLANAFFHVDLR